MIAFASTDGMTSGDGAAGDGANWPDPTSAFGTPQPLGAVNTASEEDDPTVRADGLELYFERGSDIWRSVRPDVDAPWGTPVEVEELRADGSDQDPTLSPDGLALFFASARVDAAAKGGLDIFVATRPRRDAPWTAPVIVPELNSAADDFPGSLSGDQLVIYMSSERDGSEDLYRATRASLSAQWSPPSPIVELNTGSGDRRPWISPDERAIYFGSSRSGGLGAGDIWVAVRSAPGDPFGSPTPLAGVSTADAEEEEAWLSPDQTIIYFVSGRAGGAGSDDLYVARRPSR